MQAWTDYPIIELGDQPGKKAPVREVEVIEYDGDKYATVKVDGIITSLKLGYLYKGNGRYGDHPSLRHHGVRHLERATHRNG